MIIHSNIKKFKNTNFGEYVSTHGVSHSFAKYEHAGSVEYKDPTEKMKLGSMVDQLLTEPDNIVLTDDNRNLFYKATGIASVLKREFSYMISLFESQVNYTADMTLTNGNCSDAKFTMPTKGRLDWLLRDHAVLDLKVTGAAHNDAFKKLITHMGYTNALWNYCKMAGVNKAYIIPFSTHKYYHLTGKCLNIVAIDCSGNENEFWENTIRRFGTVK